MSIPAAAPFLPGSFFVVQLPGTTGRLISIAERLAGAPPADAVYSHAGIIINTGGTVIEAEPGGARLGHITTYTGPLLISDGPVQQAVATRRSSLRALQRVSAPLASLAAPAVDAFEADVRAQVAAEAVALIGTPYSALDYLALAALHLGLPSTAIRERVQASEHMICSQLVDAAYRRVGIELFDDGRLPGDVMPSDLAEWILDYNTVERLRSMLRHPAGSAR